MFLCFLVIYYTWMREIAHCQEENIAKADIVFLKCKIHTHTHSWAFHERECTISQRFYLIFTLLCGVQIATTCMHITAHTWVQLIFNTIWPMVMGLLDPCFEFTRIMCWNPKNVLGGKRGWGETTGRCGFANITTICYAIFIIVYFLCYSLTPINNNVLAFLLQLLKLVQ